MRIDRTIKSITRVTLEEAILSIKVLGVLGSTFFIEMDGHKYGYSELEKKDDPKYVALEDLERKFKKMLTFSAGKALAWLKSHTVLVSGSVKGISPLMREEFTDQELQDIDRMISEDLNEATEERMSFVDALYTGKRYIRCKYDGKSKARQGYCVFDTKNDVIAELLGMHDAEFTSKQGWDASDNEGFDEDDYLESSITEERQYKVGDFVDLKDFNGKGMFDGKNYAVYKIVDLKGSGAYDIASINVFSGKVFPGNFYTDKDIYGIIDPDAIPKAIRDKFDNI